MRPGPAASAPRLVLASASPRRARILESLGIPFRRVVAAVDETPRAGETGAALAERLAREKAQAVTDADGLPVLAADTVVVCHGELLGKPVSPDDAHRMLRALSGRAHEVVTGVCVAALGRIHSGVDTTEVRFAALSQAAIDWYVDSGEPMDKAGAYHIDGAGAWFVTAIAGSPSNVAGLPVQLLRRLLRQAGADLGPG